VLLAKRLARHGLVLSGGGLALALSRNAAAGAVPAPLAGSTLKAAAQFAAGHVAAGAVSAPVAALTEGVLKAMFTSRVKRAFAFVLAVGLVGAGWGVYQGRAAEDPSKDAGKTAPAKPGKGGDNINLPKGPAPTQVLASIGKDGKLVIKTATMVFRGGVPRPGPLPGANPPAPPGAPPAGAGAPGVIGGAAPPAGAAPAIVVGQAGAAPAVAVAPAQMGWELRSQTYDLDDVTVLDTRGRKLNKKTVAKLLKKETVALASLWGQEVDPLHLRVLKDGVLVFVLPPPKGVPGIPGGPVGPGVPVLPPAPALPPGTTGTGTVIVGPGVPAQGPKQP
jgi:hypothetical protein